MIRIISFSSQLVGVRLVVKSVEQEKRIRIEGAF